MFRRVFLSTVLAITFASAASAADVEYVAKLSGKREIPKNDSKGTGLLEATFDGKTKVLTYTLTFDKLSGPATAAHFHGPATRKQTAPPLEPIGDKNPSSPVSGTWTLTPEQVKALRTGKIYVNIHTAAHPDGEIRGEVMHVAPKRK